jgi:hypothetical protein
MRQHCWELGLPANGDKQALLARILNEENSLTTDSQVKDSDTDQEMLRTFRGPGRSEDKNLRLNMVVKTHSLSDEACNDKVFWVRQQRQDGRIFLEEIPEGEQIWVLPEKVLTLSKGQMMAAFATSMDIGSQTFSIRPCSQGDRGCIVQIKVEGRQFGMCSEKIMDADISRAFAVAWTVMKDLKQRYDTVGTVPTKAAFFQARDQHVAMHRAEEVRRRYLAHGLLL